MGIAFLRSPEVGSSPAATPRKAAKGASKPSTRAPDADFLIHVDDAAVLVVEARTSDTPVQFNKLKGRVGRRSGPTNDLVSSPSPVLIEKAVERGLPRRALRHVAEWLAGGDKAKISWLEWGVVPKTTLERREKQLSPQESERTERVARLFVHARRALGTEAEAREFMTAPHPQLDGRSPVEAAKTDLGTRRTEQILNALEYGLAL
jgi:putative toxin-antitoxin system antitoxin component (TIGR02293 family)